ncbi:MAG TPA: hypothetical protein VHO90_13655, partial [Bacteroidales bacterium]|nr:hypothetical protein [Bacteroidales bacterium]
IQNTSRLVQEIAAASLEQTSGIKQINSAISQMNNVSQQNASSAEELASSSEELTSQAAQLRETMSFFKMPVTQQSFRQKKQPAQHKIDPVKKQLVKGVSLNLNNESTIEDDDYSRF